MTFSKLLTESVCQKYPDIKKRNILLFVHLNYYSKYLCFVYQKIAKK